MRSKIMLCLITICSGIQNIYSQKTGEIILGEKYSLHSQVLNEDRAYWVSLPDSYNNELTSYKSYPLLIVLDGHIHFKAASGMIQFMSAGYSGNRQVPEMIVVGILNVDRERDFTPDKVVTVRENNSGGGDNFLNFLENELIPELDRKYRTNSFITLVGHSLGGLLTAHAYMKEGSAFDAFISIDPSLGTWDEKVMDEKVRKVSSETFQKPIYFATANGGKRNFRNRDRHIRLYEALHAKCDGEFKAGITYYENENHGSVPLIALYDGLSFIFSGYNLPYRDVDRRDELVSHYEELSDFLSFNFLPPEELVNRIGYRFLRSSKVEDQEKAIDFFLLNTENYPRSTNAFDSLGEAYATLGEKEKAVENYKRSLQLNPENENAQRAIERLEK